MTHTIAQFTSDLLTVKPGDAWTNDFGDSTTLLYDGDEKALLILPKLECQYGCQDFKGNEKYTMDLTLDQETTEQLQKVEARLTELAGGQITLIKNGKMKVKMHQNKEGAITTQIYDSKNVALPPNKKSIPPGAQVKVAINLKSIFTNSGKARYPQVYAMQVKVCGVVEPIVECVF